MSPSERLEQRLRDWAGFKHVAARPADVRAVLDELYELRAKDHTNGSGA